MICGVEDQEEQERAVQMRQETGGQRAAMHGHRRRCRIIPIRRRAAADSLDIQPDDERSEVERVEREIREGQPQVTSEVHARLVSTTLWMKTTDAAEILLVDRTSVGRYRTIGRGVVPPYIGKSVPISLSGEVSSEI
ncbi:hypothetical protein TNIN_239631 [Trichonephila inaurata madagascariensis]|uniref:Uncharacterized protein n=1 Tax=Trichonephila inaurata madagascariensis TaxID=2747483 RepID=A0A8X6YHT0_9ARAC|nr:hypothetical protein TNIN_239631 [Trichonephila inaurata madagascariensis]